MVWITARHGACQTEGVRPQNEPTRLSGVVLLADLVAVDAVGHRGPADGTLAEDRGAPGAAAEVAAGDEHLLAPDVHAHAAVGVVVVVPEDAPDLGLPLVLGDHDEGDRGHLHAVEDGAPRAARKGHGRSRGGERAIFGPEVPRELAVRIRVVARRRHAHPELRPFAHADELDFGSHGRGRHHGSHVCGRHHAERSGSFNFAEGAPFEAPNVENNSMWTRLGKQYPLSEPLRQLLVQLDQHEKAATRVRKLIANETTIQAAENEMRELLSIVVPGEKCVALQSGRAAERLNIDDINEDEVLADFETAKDSIKFGLRSAHSVCKDDDPFDDVDWVLNEGLDELDLEYNYLDADVDFERAAQNGRRGEIKFDGDHHGMYASTTVEVPIWVLTRKGTPPED